MIERVLLLVSLSACTAPQPPANGSAAPEAAGTSEGAVDPNGSSDAGGGEPVSGLPFSHGKSFRTLDDYLTHLRLHAAPIDQPWWREVRPGVYEHVKRMPGAEREQATRDELMKRFGFTR